MPKNDSEAVKIPECFLSFDKLITIVSEIRPNPNLLIHLLELDSGSS
ncbi:hypothetical protein EV200_102357 [Pedobacter psychrotolerans]|uniref:Uncharacterized protein n=1 Tax=Pedobacter psychrotolerans TaxID=1843235 RepID=A0A4R2HJ18_9SPHI|nr:hypothetical protein EV200_102357 [Pedobacter psychrotolerans]